MEAIKDCMASSKGQEPVAVAAPPRAQRQAHQRSEGQQQQQQQAAEVRAAGAAWRTEGST